jgi:hypothetical protein
MPFDHVARPAATTICAAPHLLQYRTVILWKKSGFVPKYQ